MSITENCASFLRREFEGKRTGLLEIRRYLLLLVPPILASWWAGAPAIRLRAMGVDPSVRLYAFASGPWLVIVGGWLLVLVWLAFGLAARKAMRELDAAAHFRNKGTCRSLCLLPAIACRSPLQPPHHHPPCRRGRRNIQTADREPRQNHAPDQQQKCREP
jgi:hypothetical protein